MASKSRVVIFVAIMALTPAGILAQEQLPTLSPASQPMAAAGPAAAAAAGPVDHGAVVDVTAPSAWDAALTNTKAGGHIDVTDAVVADQSKPGASLPVQDVANNDGSPTCNGRWRDLSPRYPTPWASRNDPINPRNSYPRPSMVRPDYSDGSSWQSLNGPWHFFGGDGPVPFGQLANECIMVPYPMESDLSMIGEHFPVAYYRREIFMPNQFAGRRILLRANRVDWNATYWVNGQLLGSHFGGFDAHAFDITPVMAPNGVTEIIIRVEDPTDNGDGLIGKQRVDFFGDADLQQREHPDAAPIVSPPVSGPWSTLWLEALPLGNSLEDVEPIANPDCNCVKLGVTATLADPSLQLRVTITQGGNQVDQIVAPAADIQYTFKQPVQLWSPESPNLYYATVELFNASADSPTGSSTLDTLQIYWAFRSLKLRPTNAVIPGTTIPVPHLELNGMANPYFLHGVLWQSYFSDGFFAGASDDLYRDFVQMSKDMGFNLVRVHGKVEDPQLYHQANVLGLALAQDIPAACGIEDGSVDLNYKYCWTYERNKWNATRQGMFNTEATNIIRELRRNPSVWIWTAFNEGWGQHNTSDVVKMIRSESPGMLVNGGSGWVHQPSGIDDVLDIHDYFTTISPMHMDPPLTSQLGGNVTTDMATGKIPVLGEYGGTGMMVPGHYFNDNTTCRTYTAQFNDTYYSVTNTSASDLRAMLEYFQGRLANLASMGQVGISVYTGLSDQITECNGLWTYDFQILKTGQLDFLKPLFQMVTDAFVKGTQFLPNQNPAASG